MFDATPCAVVVLTIEGTAAVGDPFIVITKVLEGVFSPAGVDAAVLDAPVATFSDAELEPIVPIPLPLLVVMLLAVPLPYWDEREAQLESSKLVWSANSEEFMTPFVNWQ